MVARATGSADPRLFEALYRHFSLPEAWEVAPGALACFDRARAAGVRVAVLSNWDLRLRPLLVALGVPPHLDAVFVSAEVGVEKPDPSAFLRACAALGVAPERTLHVGDDPVEDVQAARGAGCAALAWGAEVRTFAEVAEHLGLP